MKLGFIDIVLFSVRFKFSLPENLMKKHWGVASNEAGFIKIEIMSMINYSIKLFILELRVWQT